MSKLYAIVAGGEREEKRNIKERKLRELPSVNAEIWVTWSNIFGRFLVSVSVSFWF